MLTNEQLTQLETRLLERLRGEDGDLAVLMAHVAQLRAQLVKAKRDTTTIQQCLQSEYDYKAKLYEHVTIMLIDDFRGME